VSRSTEGSLITAEIEPSLRPLGNVPAWIAMGAWVWWRVGSGASFALLWLSGLSAAWLAFFGLRYLLRDDDYEGEVEALRGFLVLLAGTMPSPAVA